MFRPPSSHLQTLQELDPRQNELKNALWDPQHLHYVNCQHTTADDVGSYIISNVPKN